MSNAPETEKGLLLLERIFRGGVLLGLLATSTSAVFFDATFTLSVFLGSAIAVGNIWLLQRVARRWASGQREGLLLLLLGKVWVAAAALFLLLYYLPIDASGVVVGLAASLCALFWGALVDSRTLIREAAESTKDA